MKRHQRPYGCTALTCNKTFGSKDDWKRHENSQHLQLETWCCQEPLPDGVACSKNFFRRQSVKDHLVKDHLIQSSALDSNIESCRIGRSAQGRFWCGFCTRLIDLKNRGLDAWTERFDHIDNHFMGRGQQRIQRISDWVHPQDGKGDGLFVERPSSASSSDGDSDVGCSDTLHCSHGWSSCTKSIISADGLSPAKNDDREKAREQSRKKRYVEMITCVGR